MGFSGLDDAGAVHVGAVLRTLFLIGWILEIVVDAQKAHFNLQDGYCKSRQVYRS